MRIGILSDTHDHLLATGLAMDAFAKAGVGAVIHAGDYVAPFALKLIMARVRGMDIPFFGVFGNNDGEHQGLAAICPDLVAGPLHLQLDDRKFVLIHDLQDLSHEDEMSADVIISGHTHLQPIVEERDGRLYLNPGECCGWLTGVCRAMILDTGPMSANSLILMHQERPQA